jgi:hypothetical protein
MNRTALVLKALTVALFALAFNAQTNAQTDGRGLTTQTGGVTAQPVSELPAKAKRWALVIGVDHYRDRQVGQLGGADNDARTLADALVRYAGFPADQVILLATDQPEERQPTRVNILRRLSNLASVVPKDGLLLVSFSGHGIERNGQAYLLPSDAQISEDISFLEDTAISVSRMHDRISSTGVQQVLVLLDACRNDPASGRADAPNLLTEAYTRGFNFNVRNREVVAFATLYATAVGQRAYEYGEKKQGYFTWAVVEGLKGGASNERGEVTLSGLVNYVQAQVPKRIGIDMGVGRQQRPFAVVEGYKAEDLVIAVGGNNVTVATNTTTAPSAPDPTTIELTYWQTIKNSTDPEDFKAYLAKYPNGQFADLARLRTQPPATKPEAPILQATLEPISGEWEGILYDDDGKANSGFKLRIEQRGEKITGQLIGADEIYSIDGSRSANTLKLSVMPNPASPDGYSLKSKTSGARVQVIINPAGWDLTGTISKGRITGDSSLGRWDAKKK